MVGLRTLNSSMVGSNPPSTSTKVSSMVEHSTDNREIEVQFFYLGPLPVAKLELQQTSKLYK